jgi:chromate transporter
MVLMLVTPISLGVTLLVAGCAGIALFSSRRMVCSPSGVLLILTRRDAGRGCSSFMQGVAPVADKPTLWELAIFFLKVGALTFGGGLSMLAFIQDQVVAQFGWLTPQQFVDGLALGQFTPGPVLMLAAFIGFKIAGVAGAAVTTAAIFAPSFVMILTILPLLKRMQNTEGAGHAWGGTRCDWCTCRIAGTDGAAAAPDILTSAHLS